MRRMQQDESMIQVIMINFWVELFLSVQGGHKNPSFSLDTSYMQHAAPTRVERECESIASYRDSDVLLFF